MGKAKVKLSDAERQSLLELQEMPIAKLERVWQAKRVGTKPADGLKVICALLYWHIKSVHKSREDTEFSSYRWCHAVFDGVNDTIKAGTGLDPITVTDGLVSLGLLAKRPTKKGPSFAMPMDVVQMRVPTAVVASATDSRKNRLAKLFV